VYKTDIIWPNNPLGCILGVQPLHLLHRLITLGQALPDAAGYSPVTQMHRAATVTSTTISTPPPPIDIVPLRQWFNKATIKAQGLGV
jgi:hypothetical protein